MALVRSLAVKNFRTHDDYILEVSPTVTVITGKNGSGKTSLLEALYIGLQGSSFKGSDSDILQKNTPWWRIDMRLDDGERAVTYNAEKVASRKQFVVDSKSMYRLAPKYKHPVVLFEPDDLRLLHGSPARRRDFIDRFITQLNPQYNSILRKYERALRQRNNLLKRPETTPEQLFVWDVSLSEYGAYITEQRMAFLERINQDLNTAYNTIAKSPDTVTVHYSHTLIGDTKQKMLHELTARHARDKILGFTSIGPHRHDVVFEFNHSPALSVASRGEVRSIMLALKFLEIGIIESVLDQKPIVLLDDVYSELDETRRTQLIDTIESYQTIITDTHSMPVDTTYSHIKL